MKSSYWDQHLPEIVEAIVIVGYSGEQKAREAHASFLRQYGRTAAQTPLVRFDPDADAERPFKEV